MKLIVFQTIIDGVADALERQKEPPFICHLPPRRFARLARELGSLGVCFAPPLAERVPEPRDDGNEWIYRGIVLGHVHVYERA